MSTDRYWIRTTGQTGPTDTTAQTQLAAHLADTSDAHDAGAISYGGSSNLSATDVEAALDELDSEKAATATLSASYRRQQVYNPRDYGALGDTRIVTASTTNGSPTVTSSTASFTSADVGKQITVHNSTGTLALSGTISAYTSSTQVTASANAGATVTNQRCTIGTDDTTAVQAALTALATARRGRFVLDAGYYLYSATLGLFGASGDLIKKATLEGDGWLVHKPGVLLTTWSGSDSVWSGSTLLAKYTEDLTIAGIGVVGALQNNFGVIDSMIHVTGAEDRCELNGLRFVDVSRAVCLDYSGTGRGYLTGNQFYNCAVAIQQSSAAGRATIVNNNIEAPNTSLGANTPQIECYGDELIIANNFVEMQSAVSSGIQCTSPTSGIIHGNLIVGQGANSTGITLVTGGTGMLIGPNSLVNCTGGIVTAGTGSAVVTSTY